MQVKFWGVRGSRPHRFSAFGDCGDGPAAILAVDAASEGWEVRLTRVHEALRAEPAHAVPGVLASTAHRPSPRLVNSVVAGTGD